MKTCYFCGLVVFPDNETTARLTIKTEPGMGITSGGIREFTEFAHRACLESARDLYREPKAPRPVGFW